mmetsp:Transcript_12224/g.44594  ORF Transcript_12224/g.44594 Transcript_12224/m.44594 type:complete len:229 (+) Transcript_12224:782-1468(+)
MGGPHPLLRVIDLIRIGGHPMREEATAVVHARCPAADHKQQAIHSDRCGVVARSWRAGSDGPLIAEAIIDHEVAEKWAAHPCASTYTVHRDVDEAAADGPPGEWQPCALLPGSLGGLLHAPDDMAVGGFMTAGPILSIATHQMEDSVRRHAPGIMVDAVRQLRPWIRRARLHVVYGCVARSQRWVVGGPQWVGLLCLRLEHCVVDTAGHDQLALPHGVCTLLLVPAHV